MDVVERGYAMNNKTKVFRYLVSSIPVVKLVNILNREVITYTFLPLAMTARVSLITE